MNESEYQALDNEYLSHEARSLYTLCLRRYMDFATGLVGTAKRRISYQMFKEVLTVYRRRGSTKPAFIPSTQQLRSFVNELERVGLVESRGSGKLRDYMVFLLPLATSDLNRSHEEQRRSNTQHQHSSNTQEQHNQAQQSQGIQANEQHRNNSEEQQRSNSEEQHTSVTSDTSHTVTHAQDIETTEDFDRRFGQSVDQQDGQPVQRGFSMFKDWQPAQQLTEQARLLGVDLTNLDDDQREQMEYALVEFRTWWMETKPGYKATQRIWQQKFIQTSLTRFLKNADNKNNNYAAGGRRHDEKSGQCHHSSRSNHSGSPTTRPFSAEDFDLNAPF